MAYTRVWIHFVWSTKYRNPVLTDDVRKIIFYHIKANARKKGIQIDCINGYTDHVHCLIALKPLQTMAQIMHDIKGESAFWTNEIKLIKNEKLVWQRTYFAISVSESNVNTVRKYIWNQEKHHKKKTSKEEFDQIVTKHKFGKFKDS